MDPLDALDQATLAYRLTEAAHETVRLRVVDAVLSARREGETPGDVVAHSPFKEAYVRRLAREAGISPASSGRPQRRAKPPAEPAPGEFEPVVALIVGFVDSLLCMTPEERLRFVNAEAAAEPEPAAEPAERRRVNASTVSAQLRKAGWNPRNRNQAKHRDGLQVHQSGPYLVHVLFRYWNTANPDVPHLVEEIAKTLRSLGYDAKISDSIDEHGGSVWAAFPIT